jgi:hypothetical protein
MAQQTINTGATAGDKTGDSLRTAGNKINLNFSELYSVKVPTVTGSGGKFLATDGQNLYWGIPSVQNGVVTTGTYTDPSWILSLAYSKITGAPGAYSLPTSSTSVLGGVKVDGSTITINGSGVISGTTSYTLPTSSPSILGGVKVDGSTITISNGTISSVLPTATTAVKGGVTVDGTTITINNGTISAPYSYTLPIATSGTLGGVKQGTNVSIDVAGVISVATGAGYTLPTATTSVLGGVKVDGTTIDISSGSISALSTNIRAVAAAMFTGGTQTGLTFSYNSGTGLMTSTNTNGAGGSGITGVTIQQATVTQGSASTITTVNFTGAGVTASASGSVATVNIPSSAYTLPTATASVLGGVKVDNTTITVASGVISIVARPQATTSTLGEVKVDGSSITINAGTGVISATAYSLPTAGVSSVGTLGGVKVDGSTVTINGSGVISATLPTSTLSVIGGVKPDGTSITINAGTISATAYSLPTASISTLGGVKIDGTTLSINGAGVLSSNYVNYTLPTAGVGSGGSLGGVKVDGTTVTISNGVISAVINTPTISVVTATPGIQSLSYSAGTLSFTPYLLPTASISTTGGVKVDGSTILINNGVISAPTQSSYTLSAATDQILGGVTIAAVSTSGIINTSGAISLATASVTQLGGVKVDGTTVTISNGVISAPVASYTLPTATASVLGGVKVDGTSVVINNGVISSTASFTLPTASTSILGGVKVDGTTITINSGTGVISAASAYSLPTASTSVLGGVKVDGTTVTISGGVISATGLNSRTTITTTTASLANNANANANITGYKSYALLKIQTSAAAWVRIYSDAASRTADASRASTTDPLPSAGVIAEVITTGAQTILISPGAFGFNSEATPTTNVPVNITNLSGASAAITVTLTVLQLEV